MRPFQRNLGFFTIEHMENETEIDNDSVQNDSETESIQNDANDSQNDSDTESIQNEADDSQDDTLIKPLIEPKMETMPAEFVEDNIVSEIINKQKNVTNEVCAEEGTIFYRLMKGKDSLLYLALFILFLIVGIQVVKHRMGNMSSGMSSDMSTDSLSFDLSFVKYL